MAMPAWAYYYQQVYNDKNLNIDPAASFIPPANMQNEALFDYNQIQQQDEIAPVEGDEIVPGTEYIDIPISDGREKVVTESQKFVEPTSGTKNLVPPTGKDTATRRPTIIRKVTGTNKND